MLDLMLYHLTLFCWSCNAAVKSFNIGGLFTADSFFGSQEKAAFLMALDEINNKFDGVHDELLPSTHLYFAIKYTDGVYINAIKDALVLTEEAFNGTGIQACIGAALDVDSEAVAQIFNAYSLNQVSYASTASTLSYATTYPGFFRTCTSEAAQSIAIADMIYKTFGWRKISLFYTSDSYGSDGGYVFQSEAANLGLSILSNSIIQSCLLYTSPSPRD